MPPFLRLKEIRLPEPEKFLYEVDFEMLALEGGVIPGKFIAKVRFDHGGRFRHPRIEEIEKTAKKTNQGVVVTRPPSGEVVMGRDSTESYPLSQGLLSSVPMTDDDEVEAVP